MIDSIYELIGCIILILLFIFGGVIQETIIKKCFPKLYELLTHDYYKEL